MSSSLRPILISLVPLCIAVNAYGQESRPARRGKSTDTPSPPFVFHSVPVGTKAPDFTAFSPSGQKVCLRDFRGKTVILDFWASWCMPCQASMPGLEAIYQQIKGKGVVVLSLNTWDQKPDFEKWVQENSGVKYHFDFVRDPAEGDSFVIRKSSIAKRLYGVPGIPTMYVIDRNGNVAGSMVGSGNERNLVAILAKLGISATAPQSGR